MDQVLSDFPMDFFDADSYCLKSEKPLKLMQPKTGQRWSKRMPNLANIVAGNCGLEPIDNNLDMNTVNLQLLVAALPKLSEIIPPGLEYNHVVIVFADFSPQDVKNLTSLMSNGYTLKGDWRTLMGYRKLFGTYGHEQYGSGFMTINEPKKKKNASVYEMYERISKQKQTVESFVTCTQFLFIPQHWV